MASKRTKGDAFSSYLPGWSNLPGGLLFLILDELFELVDFVRFAVVCNEWCSLARHYYRTTQRWRPNNKVLPMLMIPFGFKIHTTTGIGKILPSSLHSIADRRVCIKNLKSPVLPYGTNIVVGCSHGWLATLDELRNVIALFKPFQKPVAPILLPPLKARDRIEKVILSADPALDRNNCAVVAKFDQGNWLASMKLSEEHWSYITLVNNPSDIMFYKSRLCLCYLDGSISMRINSVYQYGFYDSFLHATLPEFLFICFIYDSYLVESTKGDLWHIFRRNKTEKFKVLKVELTETYGNLAMQQVK